MRGRGFTLQDFLQAQLDETDDRTLEKAKAYYDADRVKIVRLTETSATAIVRGTSRYEVSLDLTDALAHCTCPAFARELDCKHLVATILAVMDAESGSAFDVGPDEAFHLRFGSAPSARRERDPWFVDAFKDDLAEHVVGRLGVFTGTPIGPRAGGYSFGSWWSDLGYGARATRQTLQRHFEAVAPEIRASENALRAFTPAGPGSLPATTAIVYERLCALRAKLAGSTLGMPLPPDDHPRHPGWRFDVDARDGTLQAGLRAGRAMHALHRWDDAALVVSIDPKHAGDSSALLESSPGVRAFALAALRTLLCELGSDSSAVRAEIVRFAETDPWERVLAVVGKKQKSAGVIETGWELAITAERITRVRPLTRSLRAGRDPTAWKRRTCQSVLDQDHETSPLDREIARLVLAHGREDYMFVAPGSPAAFALLSKLAEHPRVFADSDGDVVREIRAGTMTLTFEADAQGVLMPQLSVGDWRVSPEELELSSLRRSSHVAIVDGALVVVAFVPRSLRAWVDALLTPAQRPSFPKESFPHLRAALLPLCASGVAVMPPEILGERIAFSPRPGVAVEWYEAHVDVELLIEVAPGAPLVRAATGEVLFSFSQGGDVVHVERDFDVERATLDALESALEPIIVVAGHAGSTRAPERRFALVELLREREREGAWRVEVRAGRLPKPIDLDEVLSKVVVKHDHGWFRLRGPTGAPIALGDLFRALRTASRYVALDDATFLPVPDETRQKLLPLALAASSAVLGAGARRAAAEADGELRLHEGLAPALLDVRSLLGDAEESVDWATHEERFKAKRPGRGKGENDAVERGTLREYQQVGVRWMKGLAEWAPGCVLADDMGLGKTVQTAALLLARKKKGPALVVAPASVTFNWKLELTRFVPSLRVFHYNLERDVDVGALGPGDVLVISYGLLVHLTEKHPERPFGGRFATLIVDEAQYLKNHATKRGDAVRRVDRAFTVALSGTPLENHLGELWSVFSLVFPGLLGDSRSFLERFRKPIEEKRDAAALSALGKLIAPFILRRTRGQVLRELPPRQDVVETIDLERSESTRYEALRKACELQFKARDARLTAAQQRIQMLAALTRLRQIACDASLVDKTFKGTSSKLVRLGELLWTLREEGAKTLVFSQFTTLLEKARALLLEQGHRVAYLDGATPLAARKALVERFQAGDFDVFCISLKAGGTGLNLTRASYVVHLDPWWNPAVEEQANSRAHRMGQENPVTTYRLVARGTIEEAILSMHDKKRELVSSVLEGKDRAAVMKPEELMAFIRSQGARA